MDFSISDHCDLASVACWWWRRRIPVKRPLESLVPRLKIGGSLYTFTQKIVISLLWLTFDLEQSFSSEISRIYLLNNRPKTIMKYKKSQKQYGHTTFPIQGTHLSYKLAQPGGTVVKSRLDSQPKLIPLKPLFMFRNCTNF